MKPFICLTTLIISILFWPSVLTSQEEDDPLLWLEEVEGEKALAWVKAQNAATVAELRQHSDYAPLYKRILAVLNSKDRIAMPS